MATYGFSFDENEDDRQQSLIITRGDSFTMKWTPESPAMFNIPNTFFTDSDSLGGCGNGSFELSWSSDYTRLDDDGSPLQEWTIHFYSGRAGTGEGGLCATSLRGLSREEMTYFLAALSKFHEDTVDE